MSCLRATGLRGPVCRDVSGGEPGGITLWTRNPCREARPALTVPLGNVFVYGIGMDQGQQLTNPVRRHISAARAFHTGLVADTHYRLRVLARLAAHLDVLRNHHSTFREKLIAAECSRQHLEAFEQLRHSSIATYRDLRSAIHRIHRHLNRLAKRK